MNNQFNTSVIELIKIRKSSRTYDSRLIDEAAYKNMISFLDEVNSEATSGMRIMLVQLQTNGEKKKLGTYGFISGAKDFIVGIVKKENIDTLEFGYLFEKVILKATELGLQTCWLGGGFNKKDLSQRIELADEELIAIVSPIGYKKEKARLMESAMRAVIKADNRKPWKELFFNGRLEPIGEDAAGECAIPLEMLRLAPSASNFQPWRIIIEDSMLHIYLVRKKGYNFAYDLQLNDIGIAKCHFELTANELGLGGKWQILDNVKNVDDWQYVCTWVSC